MRSAYHDRLLAILNRVDWLKDFILAQTSFNPSSTTSTQCAAIREKHRADCEDARKSSHGEELKRHIRRLNNQLQTDLESAMRSQNASNADRPDFTKFSRELKRINALAMKLDSELKAGSEEDVARLTAPLASDWPNLADDILPSVERPTADPEAERAGQDANSRTGATSTAGALPRPCANPALLARRLGGTCKKTKNIQKRKASYAEIYGANAQKRRRDERRDGRTVQTTGKRPPAKQATTATKAQRAQTHPSTQGGHSSTAVRDIARAPIPSTRGSFTIVPEQIYTGHIATADVRPILVLNVEGKLEDMDLAAAKLDRYREDLFGPLEARAVTCVKYRILRGTGDDRNSHELLGWAEGFRDGEKYVSERKYPVITFNRGPFPKRSTARWLRADDITPFDSLDPECGAQSQRQDAQAFIDSRQRTAASHTAHDAQQHGVEESSSENPNDPDYNTITAAVDEPTDDLFSPDEPCNPSELDSFLNRFDNDNDGDNENDMDGDCNRSNNDRVDAHASPNRSATATAIANTVPTIARRTALPKDVSERDPAAATRTAHPDSRPIHGLPTESFDMPPLTEVSASRQNRMEHVWEVPDDVEPIAPASPARGMGQERRETARMHDAPQTQAEPFLLQQRSRVGNLSNSLGREILTAMWARSTTAGGQDQSGGSARAMGDSPVPAPGNHPSPFGS